MKPITLEEQMGKVLLAMTMLMYGGCSSYNSDGAHGVPDSKPPSGDGEPLQDEWLAAWKRAASTRAKERVLEQATEALEGWTKSHATAASETTGEMEARMVREGRGWGVQEVAQHFNCTPTFVRRVRITAGVNATTGERPATVTVVSDESRRALELAANGMSERQIRMVMKCGGSKLQRLLRVAS